MKTFVILQALFILTGLIVNTEAGLSLTVISPFGESTIKGLNISKDFECHSEVTLVCEVKPYIDSVIWQINGHTYALCVFQDCFIYPPFPENHNFTMDLASGVFNLTVASVSNSTNNNIYKCDDGITARSVKATVNVLPNNETSNIDESAGDRITVTTGCVYPNGMEDVTFEWYITKDTSSLGGEPLTSKDENTIKFNCTESQNCTIEETFHFNNTVVFDVFEDGEDYYIYVIIKHKYAPDRPSTVQRTVKRFKVKNTDYCYYYIIIIIVVALRIALMQTLVSGYIFYKTFPKDRHNHSMVGYKWMRFVVGIPVLGFIILKKATCAGVKRDSSSTVVIHSVSHGIIVYSLVASIIDPALGICVTSLLFALSKEVTITYSRVCYTLLATVCWIGIEVVMLIQCKVFRLTGIYYLQLIMLYLVVLWIYLTYVVMFLVEQLSKIDVVNDLCNECGKYARYQCTMCTELMCEECLWSHEHIKNQCEKDNTFVCEKCCKLPVNSFCMTCEIFVCVSCMQSHRTCGKGLPRHQQHNEHREREFCCGGCKESRNRIYAAHAFCLTCSVYLCTLCLKAKHETCTLLWNKKRTGKTRDILCCEEIEYHRELPLEGVCLTCESYICKRCLKNPKEHRTHRVASHQQEHNSLRASGTFLCRGCEEDERLPVECYNLHNDEFLCAKCFENDHKSSPPERQQVNKKGNLLSFRKQIRTKISQCQIHTVLGDASPCHVEVYCLVCKIYMCRICFIRHRRIAEFWIKSQKGNMFYCKICKTDEHVYPVECCNLKTGEYVCANCYECVEHYNKRKYARGQSKDVRKITSNLKECASPCQIHKWPFNEQEKEVPGSVYCLVCKLYLCKRCFELHRRLKCVWQKQQQQDAQVSVEASSNVISKNNIIHVAKHSDEIIKSQILKTNIGLMVWWHFPLVGIGIAFLHWCCQCMRDQRRVDPKYIES